jgi:agmatine deiminase
MPPIGYRMPAEWESHRSTWLTWPKNKITWPGKLLKEVESIYLQMISALLPNEKVNLLVDDQKTARSVLSALSKKKMGPRGLIFHKVKTVDTWIRDYGPLFVISRHSERAKRVKNPMMRSFASAQDDAHQVAFTKWIFNGWGGKYADLARDDRVVDKINSLKKIRRFDPGIILEGGSLDMNGRGACLTTEQCLLNPNRNAKLSKKEIEKYLKSYLGISKVIWLKEGIEGDDTDGHVDDITRFVGPRTVLTATENDRLDKNHAILKENLEILRSGADQDGKRLVLVKLPMPGRVGRGRDDSDGDRLPASYANFYIANKVVLVPVYSHRNDKLALKIIGSVFPGRKIVGIECTALVYGLGSIHCVTQQEPV